MTRKEWGRLFVAVLLGASAAAPARAQEPRTTDAPLAAGPLAPTWEGARGEVWLATVPQARQSDISLVAARWGGIAVPGEAQEVRLQNIPLPPPSVGPVLGRMLLGLEPTSPDTHQPTLAAIPSGGRREGRTLAIVGGAALLAGALIGETPGTLMMVGGAGVGLYGLYRWQR